MWSIGSGVGEEIERARTLSVQMLGRLDYHAAWALQKERVAKRQRDEVGDTLLLVEHPDVITLGRGAKAENNIVAPGTIELVEVERGGDVTYHGPGQLVGYPILKLQEGERDLHRYLRNLEEVLIRSLARYAIAGERQSGLTGVWAGGRKLASIGVAVRRWVTLHGFALNVTTDLARFSAIHPCGLDAAVMGSIESLTGRSPDLSEVAHEVAHRFAEVFGYELSPPDKSW